MNPNRKIKDEDIAYELRVLTKRNDLFDSDTINVISHAYALICKLERRIEAIKEGFEGCCTTCEPVGLLNQKLEKTNAELNEAVDALVKDRDYFHDLVGETENRYITELDRVIAERDEARREVCNLESIEWDEPTKTPQSLANERGWNCFEKS